jgi:hypothetical protein
VIVSLESTSRAGSNASFAKPRISGFKAQRLSGSKALPAAANEEHQKVSRGCTVPQLNFNFTQRVTPRVFMFCLAVSPPPGEAYLRPPQSVKMRSKPSSQAGRPLAILCALSCLCPLRRDRSFAFLGESFSLNFMPSNLSRSSHEVCLHRCFARGWPLPLPRLLLLSFESRDGPAFNIASISLTSSFSVVV